MAKRLAAVLVVFLLCHCGVSLAENLISNGFKVSETDFGAVRFHKSDAQSSRTVVFPSRHDGTEMLFSHLQNFLSGFSSRTGLLQAEPPADGSCDNSIYKGTEFRFVPDFKGSPKPGEHLEWLAPCFTHTSAAFSISGTTARLELTLSGKKSLTCQELYLFASPQQFHPEIFLLPGKHVIEWKDLTAEEVTDLSHNGIRIFRFCDQTWGTIVDVVKTAKMFLGGLGLGKFPIFGSRVPKYMEHANKNFLHEAIGWDLVERPSPVVKLQESDVHPGDFVAILRLDGIDPIIMWGSGSHIGHTAVVMRVDNILSVCESQDGWYWPTHGIQCTPWAKWVEQAAAADFHVAILPLKPELRARFDNDKAEAQYKSVAGLPYGYHNFLFGWIDTPRDNYPAHLVAETALAVFALIDRLAPKVTETFINQALNFRLGTKGLNMAEIYAEMDRQKISPADLIAKVEDDSWVYSDGPSMVCSVFVTSIYKAAGILGDIEINATEFTPRDVYTLNIFDTNSNRPAQCESADPQQPWCQILGKYRLTLPGYSTLAPYSHMNERCPSKAPLYIRSDGC
eukprot:GILK01001916.1.p1 GENE.GILK01001916.1~~GILK01001916.1.p1  ORF type:complete len:580 (+),score=78.82 GILK01001916.1:43-1740(+)